MKEKVTEDRPVVRLSKIEISNYMNVEHGVIILPENQPVEGVFKSSIVGLYGQNGSGKSALVKSLGILKSLCGENKAIGNLKGSRLIRTGCQNASFSYEFSLTYPNGDAFTATYVFSFSSDVWGDTTVIDEETLKFKGIINGKKKNSHIVMDSCWDKYKKLKDKTNKQLNEEKKEEIPEGASFIFTKYCISELKDYDRLVLADLRYFICNRLYVVESLRIVDLSMGEIVLDIGGTICRLEYNNDSNVDNLHKFNLEDVQACISKLSDVFQVVVPGVKIHLGNENSPRVLLSERNGVSIPLTQESYGVRKIFSIIQHIVNIYNMDSYLLVVDEFDEGVFEFLLGQMLGIIKKGGQGQLLFTSHNLRPLEVLGKENIYFTTSNPSNRYIRMVQIKPHNNLRDTYFRAIQLGGQKEELYNDTDEDDIETAFALAGGFCDGK